MAHGSYLYIMSSILTSMGKFTAIGMRTPVTEPNALIINTCADNDTSEVGQLCRWSWSNPTNRKYTATYLDITAVSTEAMWQGTKIVMSGADSLFDDARPDQDILDGNWRKNKGKKPIGAYAGKGNILITNPGEARRKIYIPVFLNQISSWIADSWEVRNMLKMAINHDGNVYMRDFDTGRGIDRNGPMSHAWLLATILNLVFCGAGATDDAIKNKLPDAIREIGIGI